MDFSSQFLSEMGKAVHKQEKARVCLCEIWNIFLQSFAMLEIFFAFMLHYNWSLFGLCRMSSGNFEAACTVFSLDFYLLQGKQAVHKGVEE